MQIAAQSAHGLEVAAGGPAQAEIDASGIDRVKGPELLGDDKRRMVRQHDSAAAYADLRGRASDVPDQHRSCRTREALNRVMFSQPEALVAETLHVLSQMDRAGNGTASRLAFAHADQIENGNRQPTGHDVLDIQSER